MEYFNDRLKELQEQVGRKNRLETILKELEKQEGELKERTEELYQEKQAEEADVERLKTGSLAAFYYRVVGKMDDMLTREQEEAYAAAVKYDAAVRELEAVKADIRSTRSELGQFYGCERKYDQVMKEKAESIKAQGMPEAEEILKLEERLAALEGQKKELGEAVSAGRSALYTTESIQESLSSAEGWGTWDLLGGGMISDIAKHSHLDEAQEKVEQLQVQLRHFKTELADVDVQADMQVSIEGFLRFADYFFDGLIADWTVLDRIKQSKEQVDCTAGQLRAVLNRLEAMQSSALQEQNSIQNAIKELVRQARL